MPSGFGRRPERRDPLRGAVDQGGIDWASGEFADQPLRRRDRARPALQEFSHDPLDRRIELVGLNDFVHQPEPKPPRPR